MGAFLRKYNVTLSGGTLIRIPIIKRAVVDFAVGADFTPAAGDVKISKDGGAAANIGTLPTAVAMGNGAYWEFTLTGTELSAKSIVVTVADSATKAVEDTSFVVETYGDASAMYQADLSAANLPANVTQLLGTAWLTPGTAGTPDVNVKLISGDATAADNAEAFFDGTGYAGTGNVIPTVTTLTNLPAITANWLTATGIASDAFTAAKFADNFLTDAKVASDVTIASVTGSVGSVTGAVGSVTGSVGSVVGLTASNLDATITSRQATFTSSTGVTLPSTVASSTEVTAIQNNTRVVRVVPEDIELPASGTRTYRVELLLYDETGSMEAPDSAPTIALVNQSGTDRSSRLDSATMALVSTGRYRAIYTSTAGDTKEQLVWSFSVVEGGSTRLYGNTSYITDAVATDFTSADRAKLDTLHDTRLTAARAGYLDNLSAGAVALATGVTVTTNNDKTGYSLTQAFPSNFSSLGINASGHVSRVTLTDTVTTLTGHTAQTGDAYAVVNSGTFGNSALKTLIDTVDTVADAILLDTGTDGVVVAAGSKSGYSLTTAPPTAAENAAAILAAGDVDGFTLEQTLKLCLAALAGKLSGAATTTITIRAADDSKARITATVDADGNRSSLTLDATG